MASLAEPTPRRPAHTMARTDGGRRQTRSRPPIGRRGYREVATDDATVAPVVDRREQVATVGGVIGLTGRG